MKNFIKIVVNLLQPIKGGIMLDLINVEEGISTSQLELYIDGFIQKYIKPSMKKILIIPPDYTRGHSRAGLITKIFYQKLHNQLAISIIPALGTHVPMTEEELDIMFTSEIPKSCFLIHDHREGTVSLGKIPKEEVSKITNGLFVEDIEVEVNKELVDENYDLIISIGQVVPHEVVGMGNYTKNIFVGCGGRQMINKTHMASAICGITQAVGKDFAPARKLYDYTEQNFTQKMPLVYVLTVISSQGDKLIGVYEGVARERKMFEKAVALSQANNITYVDKPYKKVVAVLNERKFKTTWVGNKAIYRSCMLVAEGGELIILAPGVTRFGESAEADALIRQFGYKGRDYIYDIYKNNKELLKSSYWEMIASHLMIGSNNGHYTTTYATQHLTKEEIEGVGFNHIPLEEAYQKYDPNTLVPGVNILEDGEEIYYIPTPELGLWMSKDKISI